MSRPFNPAEEFHIYEQKFANPQLLKFKKLRTLGVQAFTCCYTMESIRRYRPPGTALDLVVLLTTVTLVCFSLVMIYSTTGVSSAAHTGDSFSFVRKQSAAAVVGFIMMFCFAFCPLPIFKKISPYCLPLAILLLLLTAIPGIGESAGGARRWAHVGPLRFQPSEIVKILYVIFIAGYVDRHHASLNEFRVGILNPGIVFIPIAALLLIQPDFGTFAVISCVMVAMLAVCGAPIRFVASAGGIFLLAASVLVYLSPYRMKRIMTFLSPLEDPGGKGYQLIQSLIAVGSGRAFGVGIGESQQKLYFLPAAHNDFIFAVIAEELGFFGAVCVLLMFALLLWRGVQIARSLVDLPFAYALTIGMTLLIILPALLNISVVLGLLPTKGLVLPLIGSGGSGIIASLSTVGIILSAARYEKRQRTG